MKKIMISILLLSMVLLSGCGDTNLNFSIITYEGYKGNLIGKFGIECIEDSDCDNDLICKNNTCEVKQK